MIILAPYDVYIDVSVFINELEKLPNLKPFMPISINFFKALSHYLLINNKHRTFPAIMALGIWLRNTQHLVDNFLTNTSNRLSLPRGVILHFAPANVDTMFIYSWFFSLLMGNKNIIRVSNKINESTQLVIDCVNTLLQQPEFQCIKQRTIILTYEHNNELTTFLSNHCQVRVSWGGDHTVNYIRSIPLPALATEVVFPNRHSHAIINAKSIIYNDHHETSELAKKLFNDSFWFHQKACSSPKSVIWIGTEVDIIAAKTIFWSTFNRSCSSKIEQFLPGSKIDQLNFIYYYSALGLIKSSIDDVSELPYRLFVDHISKIDRMLHCGGGVFFELHRTILKELYDVFQDSDQTLGVHGFTRIELEDFIQDMPFRTLDRIVPIGQMLNFEPVWDGVNLFKSFSREISLSPAIK